MSDPLGEALALYEDPRFVVLEVSPELAVIVAAARSWHTLTNPTDELRIRLIEAAAKAVFLDSGWDETRWEDSPRSRAVYEKEQTVAFDALLDALTDTAEPATEDECSSRP